jgi:hypothetical protein
MMINTEYCSIIRIFYQSSEYRNNRSHENDLLNSTGNEIINTGIIFDNMIPEKVSFL